MASALGGLRPVDGVGEDEGGHEAAGRVLAHVDAVLLLEELGDLADERLLLGEVQREGRADDDEVAVGLDRRQVAGLDVAGHRQEALRVEAHLLEASS